MKEKACGPFSGRRADHLVYLLSWSFYLVFCVFGREATSSSGFLPICLFQPLGVTLIGFLVFFCVVSPDLVISSAINRFLYSN